jgi:hypothetical protein
MERECSTSRKWLNKIKQILRWARWNRLGKNGGVKAKWVGILKVIRENEERVRIEREYVKIKRWENERKHSKYADEYVLIRYEQLLALNWRRKIVTLIKVEGR